VARVMRAHLPHQNYCPAIQGHRHQRMRVPLQAVRRPTVAAALLRLVQVPTPATCPRPHPADPTDQRRPPVRAPGVSRLQATSPSGWAAPSASSEASGPPADSRPDSHGGPPGGHDGPGAGPPTGTPGGPPGGPPGGQPGGPPWSGPGHRPPWHGWPPAPPPEPQWSQLPDDTDDAQPTCEGQPLPGDPPPPTAVPISAPNGEPPSSTPTSSSGDSGHRRSGYRCMRQPVRSPGPATTTPTAPRSAPL